ncbi:2-phosphosulfolactate phosphatase [Nocardioides sp.]|uniref:2-phosphosulfolactate phosphatase n=1 Tax=Nocardioides sp. TaxID=35761 RepID=UPI001A32D218|nr:2-phosphosulfolactate phosphatase [Nocardioides sp.]MBJ7355789.1 2-phosphosulfolactate phosphatase [Nocardioides sp.]
MNPAHRQTPHRVRFDWGPTGAEAIAPGADVAVVVDVLSFTTTLSVAVERGITVLPFRWKDERAAAYAAERDATLAVGRLEARQLSGSAVSLSPADLASVTGVERLVLPSPNGSSISFGLASGGATVVGACLRNRSAVARHLRDAGSIAVVAAGERWPDGSLRPCVEDLWGAGAVLAALAGLGVKDFSPEARVAADAYGAVRDGLPAALAACAGGLELAGIGFAADVEVAAAVDVSDVVPVLDHDGAFTPG